MASTLTPSPRAKLIGATIGTCLVSMLIVGSFVGALHRPTPRGLRVGVIGLVTDAQQVSSALGRHAPGGFRVTRYDSEATARRAVLDRKVDGAFVPGSTGDRLLLASASGLLTNEAVTTGFEQLAASTGQHIAVEDLRPLTTGDPDGTSQLLLFIGLALPSLTFGIAFGTSLSRELNPLARVGALALYAVLVGLAATLVADGIVGALVGAPFGLFGIAVLTAFAVSMSCAVAGRLIGTAFAGLMALLMVPVGIPAAGGPYGVHFVSSWYGDLGSALPAGAMMPAVRDIVYFNAHALATPLLVLSLWAGIAAAASFLPPLRRARFAAAITR